MSTRVIIESPFASTTATDKRRNIDYAMCALGDSIARGESPIAFHLLYPTVLSDDDKFEREVGIGRCLPWYRKTELVAVYVDYGFSTGMLRGILIADALSISIDIRRIAPSESRTPCPCVGRDGRKCTLDLGHEGPHLATSLGGGPLIW